MKTPFWFKLTSVLALSGLVALSTKGSIAPTLIPLINSVNGLTVSSNFLYVTVSGAEDDFITVFESDGAGDLFLSALANTPTGSSAYDPTGPMVAGGNSLYGTGSVGDGCIFTLNADGSDFQALYTFSGSDGSGPSGGLIFSSNVLFGTTSAGGTNGDGVVFALNTSGQYADLWSFGGTNGSSPSGGVILSGDTLYGTASSGGSQSDGTVFAIHIDGSGFTNLYNFSGNDGANPQAGLFLSGDILYGTTSGGGSNNNGTIFSIHTDGTGFETLHKFIGTDGSNPQGSPILAGSTLYGVTVSSSEGGCNLFSLNTNGQSFSVQASGFVAGLTGGLTPMAQENGTALFTAGLDPSSSTPVVAEFLVSGKLVGSLQVVVVTASLPEGTNGVGYSQSLVAANDFGPFTWKLAAGTLPKGLTLTSSGLLSGTPTAGGTYNFTVKVTAADSDTATQPLTLVIFVPDITPPTITVTSPKTGAKTSNDVYAVTGTAKDNVAVATVLVSVNGGDWTGAAPLDGWTNWNYSAGLTPGTNTISAYAVDTSANDSTVETVKLFYVVPSVLVVETNGEGTVSPEYNGTHLNVGENYSMTAKASKGFAFVNWTDGENDLLTTNETLKFAMTPGLVFIAHFLDVTKPTLSITSPKEKAKVTGNTVTVTGKAADNVGVTGVWYQFNNSAWSAASGLTNWTVVNLPVVSGTNTLKAYAADAAGNRSTTNTITFTDSPGTGY